MAILYPPEELLTLPEEMAMVHSEYAGEHAASVRQLIRVELPTSDADMYSAVVDRIGQAGPRSQYWSLCCETLTRLFEIDESESRRFHDRYDALRGMRNALIALTTVRRFEMSQAPLDYVALVEASPFEARVVNLNLEPFYPHWANDKRQLSIENLALNYPAPLDPPLDSEDLERQSQFFGEMRSFLQGIYKLERQELPLIREFAEAADSHLYFAERLLERELLGTSLSFTSKAADVLADRLKYLRTNAENRVALVAFGCRGVSYGELSKVGQQAFVAAIPQIAEELVDSFGAAQVPEIVDRFVSEIRLIEQQKAIPDLSAGLGKTGLDGTSFGIA